VSAVRSAACAGLVVSQLLSGGAWAKGSGADLLLKNFKPRTGSVDSAVTGPVVSKADLGPGSVDEFKLNDPLAVQFFTAWNDQRSRLKPEVNRWAMLFLKGEHEQVLHLWDGVGDQVSASFRPAAQSARLASLARLGLVQSVVEEWVFALNGWASSATGTQWASILEVLLPRWMTRDASATWDQVLLERGVILNPELEHEISAIPSKKGISVVSLQAYAVLRRGEQGRKLLPLLADDNRLKLPLAQTVALAQARRGDLGAAAMTLKEHAESALEKQKDFARVSSYLLQIARFLFQAGMWDESEGYLRKIPNSAPEFLTSREELAWILLRKGDVTQLRGEIASLSSSGTSDQFQPELPVVRAISNLKLCSYGAVQQDFAEFSRDYGAWAKRIDSALGSSGAIPAPASIDRFSMLAGLRVKALETEVSRLSDLHARSLKTAMPSVVGRQGHWKGLESRMQKRLELARKLEQAEYLRQWKNQKVMLGEAIRKLRFVKIELLHQIRIAEADARKGMDVVPMSQSGALKARDGEVVFPLDGVLWPDEFFRIQSQVENRCLRAAAAGSATGGGR
jgi:hypothetical protein